MYKNNKIIKLNPTYISYKYIQNLTFGFRGDTLHITLTNNKYYFVHGSWQDDHIPPNILCNKTNAIINLYFKKITTVEWILNSVSHYDITKYLLLKHLLLQNTCFDIFNIIILT